MHVHCATQGARAEEAARGSKAQNYCVFTSVQLGTLWLHHDLLYYITRTNQSLQTQLYLATKIHKAATLFTSPHPVKIWWLRPWSTKRWRRTARLHHKVFLICWPANTQNESQAQNACVSCILSKIYYWAQRPSALAWVQSRAKSVSSECGSSRQDLPEEASGQSVLGWSWSQARASWRHRVQASVGGATSTLPTCKPVIY